jgi:integrase
VSRGGLPPGIRRRHARGCTADPGVKCKCPPRYQAQAGPRRGRLTKTFASSTEALDWKRATEARFQRVRRGATTSATVEEAAERWLAHARAGGALTRSGTRYRASTLDGYEIDLRNMILPRLGARRLGQLGRGELNEFVGDLCVRGLAPSTVRNALVPLRAVYRHAMDLELVAYNPTVGVRVPSGSGRREAVGTIAEIPRLLDALPVGDRPLWATAMFAGLRRSELQRLGWAEVDLDGRVLRVRESKTAAGRRTVPIPAVLAGHLLAHRERADDVTGLVFCRGSLAGRPLARNRARPFAPGDVSDRARAAWIAAGVEPITLHRARHTYASMLVASGSTQKELLDLVGHASVQASQIYQHLFEEAKAAAAARLDELLEREVPARPQLRVVA